MLMPFNLDPFNSSMMCCIQMLESMASNIDIVSADNVLRQTLLTFFDDQLTGETAPLSSAKKRSWPPCEPPLNRFAYEVSQKTITLNGSFNFGNEIVPLVDLSFLITLFAFFKSLNVGA